MEEIQDFAILGKRRYLKVMFKDMLDMGYNFRKKEYNEDPKSFTPKNPKNILIASNYAKSLASTKKQVNEIACFDEHGYYSAGDAVFNLPEDYSKALKFLKKRLKLVKKRFKK